MQNKTKPKIGIAFGGGGTKAGAHIGVLEVLAEHGIKADMVAGTSAGSAIAALYAWGHSAAHIRECCFSMELSALIGAQPSLTGLLMPQGYLQLIREQTQDGNIEDAGIPLFITASDLRSRRLIVFDKGSIVTAVHASSALPGLISPVKLDDMLLADGGILDNCPADILYEKGADIVLAINCTPTAEFKPKNHIDILMRAFDMMGNGDPRSIRADWLLCPITEPMGVLERKGAERAYELGKACAEAHIGELKELISNYGDAR